MQQLSMPRRRGRLHVSEHVMLGGAILGLVLSLIITALL